MDNYTLLSPKEVVARVKMSRSSIDRAVDAGEFPVPLQISKKRLAWYEHEVQEWINKLGENRI